jgi:HEPN domain-containing protein
VTQEELEHAAQLYEEAAAELERALGHCRVAAEHFRNGQVPNGTAHAWAARGHLLKAAERLDGQAVQHTRKAQLPGD